MTTAVSPTHPWAQTWDALAETMGSESAGPRGRSPRVAGLTLGPGSIGGRVRQNGARVRTTRIQFSVPDDDAWRRILEALSRWPQMAGRLLAQDFRDDLGHALTAAGFRPAPDPAGLKAACTCGDRAPCRHAAALAEAVSARIQEDPGVALTLSGLSPEATLLHFTAVLGPPGDPSDPVPAKPLATAPEGFWTPAGSNPGECARAATGGPPALTLADRGPLPFWSDREPLAVRLEPVYSAAERSALRALDLLRNPSPAPLVHAESEGGPPSASPVTTRSVP